MTNQKISNEQIYELLQAQQKQFGFFQKNLERLEHRMDRFEHNQERLEDKMESQFKEVRCDIMALKNTRLTWNTIVLAGITMASSIITLIVLRVLSWMGVRLVEIPNYFV